MGYDIITTIDTDGSTKVAVKGAKGKSCKQITAEFEKSLGRVTADNTTSEYHEPEKVTIRS